MIHIVFNESDVSVLQEAILMDESMQGEVIQIKDEYAVGPLHDIYTEHGIENRKQWWSDILKSGDYEGLVENGDVDDNKTVAELADKMHSDENEIIWIWAAQNKHDVSGYYWLLHHMKEFSGRVYILYLNNLPFINEKGNIFYPEWLHKIPAREFLKAKKLARKITPSEFELDTDEWLKISSENKGVRLLEGGKKLVQEDYDFYDAELKKFITGDWQKASKLISNFLGKAKHTTGDAYLLWRLKSMIAQESVEAQGKVMGMKDFEVKLKSTANASVIIE
ncbi:MAG: DUF1835 domain-containing protein [Ferruginibacter sp.]